MADVKEVIETNPKLFKFSLLVGYSAGLCSVFTHVISTVLEASTMYILGVFLVDVLHCEFLLSSCSFSSNFFKVNLFESIKRGSDRFLGSCLGSGTRFWLLVCRFFGLRPSLAL